MALRLQLKLQCIHDNRRDSLQSTGIHLWSRNVTKQDIWHSAALGSFPWQTSPVGSPLHRGPASTFHTVKGFPPGLIPLYGAFIRCSHNAPNYSIINEGAPNAAMLCFTANLGTLSSSKTATHKLRSFSALLCSWFEGPCHVYIMSTAAFFSYFHATKRTSNRKVLLCTLYFMIYENRAPQQMT